LTNVSQNSGLLSQEEEFVAGKEGDDGEDRIEAGEHGPEHGHLAKARTAEWKVSQDLTESRQLFSLLVVEDCESADFD
jgi:hypothetical protein